MNHVIPLLQERLLQLLLPLGVWALHDEPPPVEKLTFSNTHPDRQLVQVASSAVHMYIRASKLCDVKDKCMLV